ncbi:MAG: hypothetical protein JXP34_11625, partial [Planctomycetes bacterium]|nr:hypothetical protein [Planctomycetota bacterium]
GEWDPQIPLVCRFRDAGEVEVLKDLPDRQRNAAQHRIVLIPRPKAPPLPQIPGFTIVFEPYDCQDLLCRLEAEAARPSH